LLNAEKRFTGLREFREFRSRLVEYPRRPRLIDRQIDTPGQSAVLSCKGDQVTADIDNGDVVGDAERFCFGFRSGEHALGVTESQGLH